jgi:tetratricopeptide (TPR) repeat protein
MISVPVRRILGFSAVTALSVSILLGQARPPGGGGSNPGGGPGGSNTGNIPGNTNNRLPTSPLPGQQGQGQNPTFQRPIFIQGKVMLDDGTPPPELVMVERLCNGVARPEGYTDAKGRFSFELGRNNQMLADASTNSTGDFGSIRNAGGSTSTTGTSGATRGISERDLMGCELRANLAGYRSDIVNLGGRRVLDSPDVGTIILHRLANVEGYTVSATSAMAPKEARKAYDKAQDQIKKNKWTDAKTSLEKAVAGYPKYAAAWYELGRAWENENNVDEARKSYGEALNADSKFVKPYLPLAGLAMRDKKWQDVVDITSRLNKLDPYDYPRAYYYSAVANFNLQKLDEAEKSAREAVKLDTDHTVPKANHVLGVILANKQDYAGAAESMKAYLLLSPDGKDNEFVRKQLADIERSLAAKAGTPAPPPQQQ